VASAQKKGNRKTGEAGQKLDRLLPVKESLKNAYLTVTERISPFYRSSQSGAEVRRFGFSAFLCDLL